MNTSPKFTIITVTYNAAHWLERTILSILSQSYPNIEYIIIDGASTDGTIGLIKQYAPGISFWISEPDQGIYDAMNKGLQHATGDYVWFLNAGDTFPNADTLQRIATKIGKKKELPDVIYGKNIHVTSVVANTSKTFDRAFRLLTKWKEIPFEKLITHEFHSLEEFIPTVAHGHDEDYIKGVLTFEDENQ